MSKAEHFGRLLRTLRQAAGLTQKQLAERSGLHTQAIVKLERGERQPAWATVITLAGALGVTCLAFVEPASPDSAYAEKPAKHRRARDKQ